MSRTELTPSGILYTDSSNNTANVSFSEENITFDKPLQVQKGVKSFFAAAGSRPDENFRPAQALGSVTTLSLKNITNESVTLEADENTSSFSLTLPTTQGDANTYLKNDGTGILSWNAVGASVGLNHARNYGSRKAWFSTDRSTDFNNNLSDIYLSESGTARWKAYSNTVANVQPMGGKPLMISQFTYRLSQMVLSWNQGTSSVYWDIYFHVFTRIFNGNNNTDQGWFMFGNDTIDDPTLNPVPGVAISTGIALEHNTGVLPNQLRLYEAGVLKKSWEIGFRNTNGSSVWRLLRNDRTIRLEIVGSSSSNWLSQSLVVEYELTPGFEPTGTRWGLSAFNKTTDTGPQILISTFESYAV